MCIVHKKDDEDKLNESKKIAISQTISESFFKNKYEKQKYNFITKHNVNVMFILKSRRHKITLKREAEKLLSINMIQYSDLLSLRQCLIP